VKWSCLKSLRGDAMGEMLHFFANSFFAAALLSIAIGVVGSLMVINRYNYLAASIAHGSYGGVGMALYFGGSILLGATLFAVALALLLAFMTYRQQRHLDIFIGVLWAVGMSIGIIFTDLTPGYTTDLLSYLFGDILMIPNSDLWFMGAVDLLATLFLSAFYHQLLAIAYDKEFALTRNVPVALLHTLTLFLIALTIVMSIRSIGLILVIALFSIPPYIAERFAKNFWQMVLLSIPIAFSIIASGLIIAYYLDISATAIIIVLAALAFSITFLKGER